MTRRLATLALLALTLLAAVCLRVLHGLVWRKNGARVGDPSYSRDTGEVGFV